MVCLTSMLGISLMVGTTLASQCKPMPTPKSRLFLLSDIANEPDDAQSLVRLMTYVNEFRIEGLIATTSIWLNDTTRPDQMHDIVDAYGESLSNLKSHAEGWPEVNDLKSLIASGLPVYGMDGVGKGKDSDGSKMLVEAVDKSEEPLWVLIWGGASVLAQALWHVKDTRSAIEVDLFVSRIRAYAISDQDNTGTWIRRNFPRLFYIASVHHFNRYAAAAWGGITGDEYYHFPSAASQDLISPEWIKANIQSAGPLGSKYPDPHFIVEGDTPSLLYMIPNGLSDPEHPEWGSWGGRYGPVAYGEGHFADSVDTIVVDDKIYMGPHVTLWRWRDAFQRDFAARIRWSTTAKPTEGKHAPVATINGDSSRSVIEITTQPSEKVTIDASTSCSPDSSALKYKWWQYLEPSSNNNNPKRDVAILKLSSDEGEKIEVQIPEKEIIQRDGRNAHPEADKHLHLILEVSDGELVTYRRVVFTVLGLDSEKKLAHDEL